MLKKSITYTDYNDETKTENFYFNLSKAELVEMEMSESGGLSASLQEIINSEDGKGVIEHFKKIILAAYGIKTPDGRFKKSKELSDDFASTAAYSELFVELATNEGSAAAFINGVVPQGMAQELATMQLVNNVELPPAEPGTFAEMAEPAPSPNVASEAPPVPTWQAEGREPNEGDLASMTREQLVAYMKSKQGQ